MSAPAPAWVALIWVIVGVPVLVYAVLQVRRGRVSRHAGLMVGAVIAELGVFASFSLVDTPSPRRPALQETLYFRIHVILAVGTLVGMAWQLVSRAIPALRWLHRHTGPWVVGIWCLALLTGAGNFVYLYIMGS